MAKAIDVKTAFLFFLGINTIINIVVMIIKNGGDAGSGSLDAPLNAAVFVTLFMSLIVLWNSISNLDGHKKKLYRRAFYLFLVSCPLSLVFFGMLSPFGVLAELLL